MELEIDNKTTALTADGSSFALFPFSHQQSTVRSTCEKTVVKLFNNTLGCERDDDDDDDDDEW